MKGYIQIDVSLNNSKKDQVKIKHEVLATKLF